MMMTGRSRCLALIFDSSSMPEPPGMRMSRHQHLRRSVSRAASTSRALVKLRTTNSSRVSAFSSTKRIDWSSSTIQMGFMRSDPRRTSAREAVGKATSGEGNHDLEDRAAGLAFKFDGAMVLLDEGLRKRESESRAAFAARHRAERRSDRATTPELPGRCPRYAIPVPDDSGACRERDLPRHACPQDDLGIADLRCVPRAPRRRCGQCSAAPGSACSRSPRNSGIEVS